MQRGDGRSVVIPSDCDASYSLQTSTLKHVLNERYSSVGAYLDAQYHLLSLMLRHYTIIAVKWLRDLSAGQIHELTTDPAKIRNDLRAKFYVYTVECSKVDLLDGIGGYIGTFGGFLIDAGASYQCAGINRGGAGGPNGTPLEQGSLVLVSCDGFKTFKNLRITHAPVGFRLQPEQRYLMPVRLEGDQLDTIINKNTTEKGGKCRVFYALETYPFFEPIRRALERLEQMYMLPFPQETVFTKSLKWTHIEPAYLTNTREQLLTHQQLSSKPSKRHASNHCNNSNKVELEYDIGCFGVRLPHQYRLTPLSTLHDWRRSSNHYKQLMASGTSQGVLSKAKCDVLMNCQQVAVAIKSALRVDHNLAITIKAILTERYVLIQGPPGTGKTHLACSSIETFVARNLPVMVLTMSNDSLDNILLNLAPRMPLQHISRIGSNHGRRAAHNNEIINQIDLHTLVSQALTVVKLQEKLQRIVENYWTSPSKRLVDWYAKCYDQYRHARNDEMARILSDARVYALTVTGAAQYQRFFESELITPRVLVVEEAAQVLEAQLAPCFFQSVEQVIMIGDHKQLGPIPITSEKPLDVENFSLFERMLKSGHRCYRLNTQFRMSAEISVYAREMAYPSLKDDDSVLGQAKVLGMAKNVFFLDHRHEEHEVAPKKYVNDFEVRFVVAMCEHLVSSGEAPANIIILAMYREQRFAIERLLEQRQLPSPNSNGPVGPKSSGRSGGDQLSMPKSGAAYSQIRVSTVDGFQGHEADIVLVSCVRSNAQVRNGFLRDPYRLNVALTRARRGMYFIGNLSMISRSYASRHWYQVVRHIARRRKTFGTHLPIVVCQKHAPTRLSYVSTPDELYATIECKHECGATIDACGHQCRLPCNHSSARTGATRHKCHDVCQRKCAKCDARCDKPCGHSIKQCVVHRCQSEVIGKRWCGHRVRYRCSQARHADEIVCPQLECSVRLACGHKYTLQCAGPRPNIESINCNELCNAQLDTCKHKCQALCYECKRIRSPHKSENSEYELHVQHVKCRRCYPPPPASPKHRKPKASSHAHTHKAPKANTIHQQQQHLVIPDTAKSTKSKRNSKRLDENWASFVMLATNLFAYF